MIPDHTTIQVRSSGFGRSSWKGLTQDATRRLRIVVHAAGWLHSMVLHGRDMCVTGSIFCDVYQLSTICLIVTCSSRRILFMIYAKKFIAILFMKNIPITLFFIENTMVLFNGMVLYMFFLLLVVCKNKSTAMKYLSVYLHMSSEDLASTSKEII